MPIAAIFFHMKVFILHDRVICISTLDIFYQTLLPSVTRQQNVEKYWWEGSTSSITPPASASDVLGQHNKIGFITFGAVLVLTSMPDLLKSL